MTQESSIWLPYANAALAAATLLATVALAVLTYFLAKHTKRMADGTSQAHVVATIEPNPWSLLHFDLRVENSGNGVAYDIKIAFDPPLQNGKAREGHGDHIPFQNVSVLRPGQHLRSYLSDYAGLKDKKYTVTVSWASHPKSHGRESHTYDLDIGTYEAMSQLGASEAIVQIAEQVKKLREDWRPMAQGSKKLKTDVYTEQDRKKAAGAATRPTRRNEKG